MQCVETDNSTMLQPEYSHTYCIWLRAEPTMLTFIIYAFIVPILAFFGLCANFINAIVFMRPKMTPSAFSYLAALSWLDCVSCLLIALTAFSRSIFFKSNFWLVYDFQWQIALFGMSTGAANLILACVSCDRLVYLRSAMTNARPQFCKRKVARRMIIAIILVSIAFNLPYFFVFVVNKNGSFHTTHFYSTPYYKIHNWMTFLFLAVAPAIFLLIGNIAIIVAFRRWTKQGQICQKRCNSNLNSTEKRNQHQMKLTITILIVITLYMVGELPAHLTSRKSALNLLFGGDISKVNFEVMQNLEIICITLNAVQLSLNIIIYAVINPCFMPEFFTCLHSTSDICFKMFCLTAIESCWRDGCRMRRSSEQIEPEHQCNERQVVQREGRCDSWGIIDDSCSGANAATMNLANISNMNCVNVLGDEGGGIPSSSRRWSCLNEFAVYNLTFRADNIENVTEERRDAEHRSNRDSRTN